MVQHRSMLNVADNTGVKQLMVIQIYGGSKRKHAKLGGLLGCVVKKVLPNTTYKKGDKVKVVLVRTKKEFKRRDGTYIRFSENAAVIVENEQSKAPIGTRIFGPIAYEIRDLGYAKIASLANHVV
ncbi:MAG: 50S ribosomal protein L14 [Candidatus Levybacteria bacterium RIFCSPHIGHO2_02_FULL_40_18]|nr:MAG: 50S ribosomal protein L14 [Candidatus Levybacteria bacterium RIFCSPHIGHO2_01_FULL_40_58]OGH26394.1 MAG: 50S ribosomal protein L14 [Candidatus Levybacteria bacterium RIFCSPHIGHO2_02_FULL_40_18]OGH31841.1 MAG: 50S ribosomal protein L14 [Candidatus Levybacteria bacterium RIFCSPHIGHO2_12_FULL_40_31]OGH40474.1 MAG: 50S ribosomal protein L14 [Candidatus Levybacteria bacterium RIFCSPLOWO2_01_FULL_40_64]OGH49183.1 MAG: 50S ribosomal protein L14 [Candidatus Levybacteria bacterium RIFCSPLOWO2_02_